MPRAYAVAVLAFGAGLKELRKSVTTSNFPTSSSQAPLLRRPRPSSSSTVERRSVTDTCRRRTLRHAIRLLTTCRLEEPAVEILEAEPNTLPHTPADDVWDAWSEDPGIVGRRS